MNLMQSFAEDSTPKEHNFRNHLINFLTLLKKNCTPVAKRSFKKWEIYAVDYSMGIGSEITSTRPSIIYKNSAFTKGDDVIVLPLTSALQQKQSDRFDILVEKSDTTQLYQRSYARLRQLRSVSVGRLGKLIGTITDEKTIKEIDSIMGEMLGMTC